jgi:hypothetical protein
MQGYADNIGLDMPEMKALGSYLVREAGSKLKPIQ